MVEGDDHLGALGGDGGTDGIGVVAAIGNEPIEAPGGRLDQLRRHGHVVDVAGREHQQARPALGIGQSVELAGAAAARDAYGLRESPPFAPPAERCALMCVASMATVPHTPLWPVSASNMPSQMPCRLQRLKRL